MKHPHTELIFPRVVNLAQLIKIASFVSWLPDKLCTTQALTEPQSTKYVLGHTLWKILTTHNPMSSQQKTIVWWILVMGCWFCYIVETQMEHKVTAPPPCLLSCLGRIYSRAQSEPHKERFQSKCHSPTTIVRTWHLSALISHHCQQQPELYHPEGGRCCGFFSVSWLINITTLDTY